MVLGGRGRIGVSPREGVRGSSDLFYLPSALLSLVSGRVVLILQSRYSEFSRNVVSSTLHTTAADGSPEPACVREASKWIPRRLPPLRGRARSWSRKVAFHRRARAFESRRRQHTPISASSERRRCGAHTALGNAPLRHGHESESARRVIYRAPSVVAKRSRCSREVIPAAVPGGAPFLSILYHPLWMHRATIFLCLARAFLVFFAALRRAR
jgi:hypothetical protein